MKKILLFAVLFVFALSSCGKKTTESAAKPKDEFIGWNVVQEGVVKLKCMTEGIYFVGVG